MSLESPQKCHLPNRNKKMSSIFYESFSQKPNYFLNQSTYFVLLYLQIIMIPKVEWKNSKNSRNKYIKEKQSRNPSNKATVITFYDQFI
jgi:hypothetical protein